MSENYMKDIIYDLINSKLKNKELEDKLKLIEEENLKLEDINTKLTKDNEKWKLQVVSYIDDYRKVYGEEYNSDEEDANDIEFINADEKKEIVNIEKEEKNVSELVENKHNSRKEYMKDYMKNKRAQKKEEMKNIIINKS